MILSELYLQQPHFQVRSYSEVQRVRTSTYKFWGDTIQFTASNNSNKQHAHSPEPAKPLQALTHSDLTKPCEMDTIIIRSS